MAFSMVESWGEENTLSREQKIQAILEDARKEAARRESHQRREDEVNHEDMVRVSGRSTISMGEPSPKEPSATERNFQTLSHFIDDTLNLVSDIEQRISPILISRPTGLEEKSPSYGGPTGVSERLGTLCSRLEEVNQRLRDLLGAVDL